MVKNVKVYNQFNKHTHTHTYNYVIAMYFNS